MSSVELAAIAFPGSSACVLAYIPQIVRLARDRNGGTGKKRLLPKEPLPPDLIKSTKVAGWR